MGNEGSDFQTIIDDPARLKGLLDPDFEFVTINKEQLIIDLNNPENFANILPSLKQLTPDELRLSFDKKLFQPKALLKFIDTKLEEYLNYSVDNLTNKVIEQKLKEFYEILKIYKVYLTTLPNEEKKQRAQQLIQRLPDEIDAFIPELSDEDIEFEKEYSILNVLETLDIDPQLLPYFDLQKPSVTKLQDIMQYCINKQKPLTGIKVFASYWSTFDEEQQAQIFPDVKQFITDAMRKYIEEDQLPDALEMFSAFYLACNEKQQKELFATDSNSPISQLLQWCVTQDKALTGMQLFLSFYLSFDEEQQKQLLNSLSFTNNIMLHCLEKRHPNESQKYSITPNNPLAGLQVLLSFYASFDETQKNMIVTCLSDITSGVDFDNLFQTEIKKMKKESRRTPPTIEPVIKAAVRFAFIKKNKNALEKMFALIKKKKTIMTSEQIRTAIKKTQNFIQVAVPDFTKKDEYSKFYKEIIAQHFQATTHTTIDVTMEQLEEIRRKKGNYKPGPYDHL